MTHDPNPIQMIRRRQLKNAGRFLGNSFLLFYIPMLPTFGAIGWAFSLAAEHRIIPDKGYPIITLFLLGGVVAGIICVPGLLWIQVKNTRGREFDPYCFMRIHRRYSAVHQMLDVEALRKVLESNAYLVRSATGGHSTAQIQGFKVEPPAQHAGSSSNPGFHGQRFRVLCFAEDGKWRVMLEAKPTSPIQFVDGYQSSYRVVEDLLDVLDLRSSELPWRESLDDAVANIDSKI